MIQRVNVLKSKLVALALAAVTLAGVSCRDLTGVDASLQTITDSGTAWAINGAPLGAQTALYGYTGTLLQATPDGLFDIAFDLDSLFRPVILPQRAVLNGLALSTHTVSLATVPGSFESVTSVPKGLQFRADTAMTVTRDQVVIAQIADANVCTYSLTGTTLFVKLVVRSINREQGTMFVAYTVDPNCGFRSFAPGIPKD
jgi:hypothetical protein